MDAPLFTLFALQTLAVVALALLALRGVAATWARFAVLALAGAALTLAYGGGAELLSRAKPARLALFERGDERPALAASHMVEGEAIWLWLVLPGSEAPRAYRLPWSLETAEALRRAEARAQQRGTRVEVERPFAGDDMPPGQRFRVPPREPLPPKPGS